MAIMLNYVLQLLVYALLIIKGGTVNDVQINFQSELKSSTYSFTTFADCAFERLQTNFSTLYNKTGWRREPPTNVKATKFCKPNGIGVNQSGINLQWNLPNSHSAAGISGYEVRLEGDPGNFRCLLIILEEKITQKNLHMVLNSTMYPVERNHHYMIVLHSLPRANNSERESRIVVSMDCKRGFTSSSWSPARHNFSYNWPEKTLVVWFPEPPAEFNITKFKLNLLPDKDKEMIQKVSNKTEIRFTNVDPGTHLLYMEPYDEHRHDMKLCVCKDDDNKCRGCKLNKWQIVAKKPKTHPPTSKGQGHGITVGVPVAAVVFAIVLFLLYKCLAKTFGIECVLGKRNKKRNDDILHVLCIDTYSSEQEFSRLRHLLVDQLDRSIRSQRIMFTSNDDISVKIRALWTKWNIEPKHYCTDENGGNTPSVITGNILICLLLSEVSMGKLSQLLAMVKANMPETEQIRIQICAVTFEEKVSSFQCGAMTCFVLKTDQQKLISAIKMTFPKQMSSTNTTVIYNCNGVKPSNGFHTNKLTHDSNLYIALPDQTVPGNDILRRKVTNCQQPEVAYFAPSEPRRERYVSNDSGQGDSVNSYRPSQLHDDTSVLWQDSNMMPSIDDVIPKNRFGHLDCASCNISFYPPDPSIVSEDDCEAVSTFQDRKCPSCMQGMSKTNAQSMDSLMDKMAQINERSALIHQQTKPGEVQSVLEGCV